MSKNSFGKQLVLTTFGESHGAAVGGVLDGFPAGFEVDLKRVQQQINRRRPGKGDYTSPRKEDDVVEWLSGIYKGKTLGTPIAFILRNHDSRPQDYDVLKDLWRPSHGDFTWEKKYGFRDHRGGGRSSARETAARVAAGALAAQYLEKQGITIAASVTAIGGVEARKMTAVASVEEVDASPLRCLDREAEKNMLQALQESAARGDTLGGIISCVIEGLPAGLGEPVFDKFQAVLARAMMSINAAKGFEYGEGFAAAAMRGSEHNDVFENSEGVVRPATNHAGGVLGGITTGQPVFFRVAFKPIASLRQAQTTVNKKGEKIKLTIGGRHDITTVPRAVPIVEAMAALTVTDFLLWQKLNQK